MDRKWSGMERMRERMERRPYGGGLALGVWQQEEDTVQDTVIEGSEPKISLTLTFYVNDNVAST